ncbi:MAG: cytochrome c oxidase assembly protein, partial [Gammaproteobacteria bacterium]|nr:cytochrome c oxidase assembly protein [Gemmatimonadota bacterium]NIU79885.1 cytochrome c oxidase assembly protein [Gammaproteobacteria bacterium]NIX24790.1 cytochrome c oxidase assembly protein [Actinomycetota bacterium]
TGDDQRLAGLLMKFGGAVIHWVAITVLFILWYRDQADEPLEPGTAGAP